MAAVITGYGDWIQKWAEVAPWRVAIRETRTGMALHYGELSARSWRWAHTLGALGVKAGDRVAIIARNAPACFELLVACWRRGAAYTPLNWRLAVPFAGILEYSWQIHCAFAGTNGIESYTIEATRKLPWNTMMR